MNHKPEEEPIYNNKLEQIRENGITYDGIPYSEFKKLSNEVRYKIAHDAMFGKKTHS